MKATNRAALVLLLVLGAFPNAARTAGAHPFDSEYAPPTDYAGVLHRVGEMLTLLRMPGAAPEDLARRAERLATLASAAPGFALALPGADTAAARIVPASVRLRVAAEAMQRAARTGEVATIATLAAGCEDAVATLDAFVPWPWVCPMHCEPGRTYEHAGSCPVCGMHLQKVTSDRYTVDVVPGGPLRAGVPVTLSFQVRDPAGFAARDLDVVHEKLLHLIVVSQDLARFDHVHPEPGPEGRFTLRHTFPAPGRYVLFHDFTPRSSGLQVVPVELVVEGNEAPPVPLVVDDRRPKRVAGFDVALAHGPLVPGAECTMTFTLSRGGKPVTDLEPFLGAAGHLVMISEDRGSYVHSHPLAVTAGPSIEFRTRFDRTGTYRAWGQFQHRGRVITVPFTVEVSDQRSTRLER